MTRQEIIEFCLTFPASYEDYPFDDITDASAWTAMRYRANKKTFAFITMHYGRLIINLKCDPFEADVLRQMFEDVIPGYHMNKTHRTANVGTQLRNHLQTQGLPVTAVMGSVHYVFDLFKKHGVC